MSDDGTGTDRPRWEGFPGGVDPTPPNPAVPPTDSGGLTGPSASGGEQAGGYVPPTAPQFPVVPPEDLTAPMPVVSAAAVGGSRRSHRAEASGGEGRNRYLAAGAVALLAVAGAGFVLANLGGDGGAETPSVSAQVPIPSQPVAATTSVAPTPSTSATSSTSAATSVASPTESVVNPGVTGSPRSTRAGSPSETLAPGDLPSTGTGGSTGTQVKAVKQPLVVLNNTRIVGLAARTAASIEAKGWTVTETANWFGANIPGTTIYFQPGAKNKASAKLFAKQFDVVTAVRPALPGMDSTLVLVLTADAA